MQIEEAKKEIEYAKSFGTSGVVPRWEAIETVLNELEKKDAKIERLKNARDNWKKTYYQAEKELEKLNKVIEAYETGCRRFKAFCRRVRRDEKHDVDDFNQGQEHMCNQFLNLLNGDKNWSYEGKYFDEYDKEMEEIKQCFSEKAQK